MHEGNVFDQKLLEKAYFIIFQNDRSGHGPACQFWLLESALSVRFSEVFVL